MKKEDALRVIVESAKLYQMNLENKNLLFIFLENNKTQFLETMFTGSNFLHLTGVQTDKKLMSANSFYKKCINSRLSLDEFDFKRDGTTVLKIPILKQLMSVSRISKMIGNFNCIKPILYTEKVAGNTNACLGFIRDNKSDYYVPVTALKEDIRDITESPQARVIAIFQKDITEVKYRHLTYTAKGIIFSEIRMGSTLSNKIDSSNLIVDYEQKSIDILIKESAEQVAEGLEESNGIQGSSCRDL